MKRRFFILLLVLAVIDSGQIPLAHAAAQMDQEQALLLEAAVKSMKHDLRGAEDIYDRVISLNKNSIEGYLQRGVIRRSLNNSKGAESDAARARGLIDVALTSNANDANLYYQRSLADRVLKDFDAAEQDLKQSIRLGHRDTFDNDMKAIEVERKMVQ